MTKIQNSKPGLVFNSFEIRICLGFGYSDFEFSSRKED
jgi:hypothetical protein